MSKFWGGSSSEDDTEDDEPETETEESASGEDMDSDSDDGANQFMASSDEEDSDSDTGRRVVRSAKDKRFAELYQTADQLKNSIKINDWVSLQNGFDKMNKQLEKVMRVAESVVTPRAYIRALVTLEDFVNQTFANKEAKKKMSSTNAKAFNAMRQKIRKHNKDYEELIAKFRENPESTEEEEEEESEESEAESDGEVEEEAKEEDKEVWQKSKKKSISEEFKNKEITVEMVDKKLIEIIRQRGKKGTDRQEQVDQLIYLASVAVTPGQCLDVLMHVVSAYFDVNQSMSTDMPVELWRKCGEKVNEIIAVVHTYPEVLQPAEDREQTGQNEENGRTITIARNLVAYLERLDDELFKSLQVLDPHTNEYIQRLKDEASLVHLAQKVQDYCEAHDDSRGVARIALRRIEHIYYKNSEVYQAMIRIHAEQLAKAAAEEEESKKEEDDGFTHVGGDQVTEDRPKSFLDQCRPVNVAMASDLHDLMRDLTTTIYRVGDERTKARAMLCDICSFCIHDDFHEARDRLLMSHLQENVHHMDISTQILFNRTMAQLGLCAFRAGLIADAHSCLAELYAGGRVKELLAQGVGQSRHHDKTAEQEKLERQRQMPFHMHINLELLETVHLICAMLLEVPNMALTGHDSKQRVISKPYRRLLDNYERMTFTGPPENVRDHIMAATHHLCQGDWRAAARILVGDLADDVEGGVDGEGPPASGTGLAVWALVPKSVREDLKRLVRTKLQEEGLRTYLLTYASAYTSVSLDKLSSTFGLQQAAVHSIVCRMIMNEELFASWDEPTQCLVMHKIEPTRLQMHAMQLSEKCTSLLEQNERILEARGEGGDTGMSGKDKRRRGDRDGDGDGGRRPWGARSGRGRRDGYGPRGERGYGNYNRQGNRGTYGYDSRNERPGRYQDSYGFRGMPTAGRVR
mmetsp:Transcript_8699/g.32066  ORF Transcript_8699/g.32066 Transcript_8699/m.32066 type:complete len:918 (+) Transcript_8699:109-2862(+)|eukprot:scaffold1504_cov417-Prasinococcus_capsulatus_cf.AAC.55